MQISPAIPGANAFTFAFVVGSHAVSSVPAASKRASRVRGWPAIAVKLPPTYRRPVASTYSAETGPFGAGFQLVSMLPSGSRRTSCARGWPFTRKNGAATTILPSGRRAIARANGGPVRSRFGADSGAGNCACAGAGSRHSNGNSPQANARETSLATKRSRVLGASPVTRTAGDAFVACPGLRQTAALLDIRDRPGRAAGLLAGDGGRHGITPPGARTGWTIDRRRATPGRGCRFVPGGTIRANPAFHAHPPRSACHESADRHRVPGPARVR